MDISDKYTSFAKIYLTNKAKIISKFLNKKMPFLKPNHITTFGIILNASALMNLINYEFVIFVLLSESNFLPNLRVPKLKKIYISTCHFVIVSEFVP